MAPLTRMRSKQPGNIPYALNAQYYAQRAGAGLIITEATQISQQGQGYPGTPGIHSPEQVVGWQSVTQSVQAKGARYSYSFGMSDEFRILHTSLAASPPLRLQRSLRPARSSPLIGNKPIMKRRMRWRLPRSKPFCGIISMPAPRLGRRDLTG